MTGHPVKDAGGNGTAIRAFEAIATGLPPRCTPQTLEWLISHGLVHRLPPLSRRDRWGTYMVPQFAVHAWARQQWFAWGEQP